MRSSVCIALVIVATFVAIVAAAPSFADPSTKNLLVVVDDFGVRASHSKFFEDLTARGYKLTFATAADDRTVFYQYGEFQYNGLIIFASDADDISGITKATLFEFVEQGGNVLIAGSSSVSEVARTLATECGISIDESGSSVVDHFSHHSSDDNGLHTLVLTDRVIRNTQFAGAASAGQVAFRGVGLSIDEENPLLTKVVTARTTAYTTNANGAVSGLSQGGDVVLVAALQSRTNGRVTIAGSLEMLSDEFFELSAGGKALKNRELAAGLSAWTFKEVGVLRTGAVSHNKAGESSSPAEYTVRNQITYSIEIFEFSNGEWRGYNGKDVQLEFVMLDPLVRTFLTADNKGTFSTTFEAPDVYGVFKFNVIYNRPGFSWLSSSTQFRVRPYRLNEYERFIDAAYPYYASAISVMIGFFIFSVLFLLHKPADQ